jgi:hypothetical protein
MDKERSAVMALQAQVTGLSITQEVMACVYYADASNSHIDSTI